MTNKLYAVILHVAKNVRPVPADYRDTGQIDDAPASPNESHTPSQALLSSAGQGSTIPPARLSRRWTPVSMVIFQRCSNIWSPSTLENSALRLPKTRSNRDRRN